MTDVIKCPYCKHNMELRELGFVAKIVFYECPNCLSRSPQTNNKYTANSMATMGKKRRLQPTNNENLYSSESMA